MPNVTHDPPSPPAAPQPKRARAASVLNDHPLPTDTQNQTKHAFQNQSLVEDQTMKDSVIPPQTPRPRTRALGPAMRKAEIVENYDDENEDETKDEEMDGTV